MKVTSVCLGVACGILAAGMSLPATAQVTSDGTTNTIVNQSGNNFNILNGIEKGNNLFHSFSNFSVPTGGSATFDLTNTPNITTIFSRVTGGNISNIDGLIQTLNSNNPVSLFLMNPNGIVFGQNASLNIGGSFVATTANSIKFADGKEFSTVNASSPPLLTMSVPVGLQMGSNARAINVQGQLLPNSSSGLQVTSGQTFSLVGSDINLTQANLRASDGHIELWALQNGEIAIKNDTKWQLTSEPNTINWGNITLQQVSLVDASGINGGAIYVQGRGLTLQDGSSIMSNTSAGQGRGIIINTTEFVDLLGASSPGQTDSGLKTTINSSGTGRAGDIKIETSHLRITNGARLKSTTFGNNSRSGDIEIQATDIEVFGTNPFPNSFGIYLPTSITTLIYGNNNQGGNITIETARLRTVNGGLISSDIISSTLGKLGKTGNISIQATESFEIAGGTGSFSSGVTTSIQPSGAGQGGNIAIETGILKVSNGGSIRSTLAGNGTAGNITIRATDVTVSDPVIDPLSQFVTGINTSVGKNVVGSGGTINLTADNLRVFNGGQITSSTDGNGAAGNVNLQVNNITIEGNSQPLTDGRILSSTITASSTTTSDAGSVNLVANQLNVLDNGQISVSNIGGGNSGNLLVHAKRINLERGGSLLSEASAGDRGNITLNTDVLLMRYGSRINTNATGIATGGNINIHAPIIIGLENSDITANAIQGAGGNINIQTQGLFGLEFRDQLTRESDITASSQFGLSGTVQINNFGVDPNSGLIELPANVTDQSQQIASGCSANTASSFVATGRGGIPQNPTQEVGSDVYDGLRLRTWYDIRDISAYRKTGAVTAQIRESQEVLVQATGWRRNAQGKIEIFADKSPDLVPQALTCAAVIKS
jgi:filamentous hemagglutinin family protein